MGDIDQHKAANKGASKSRTPDQGTNPKCLDEELLMK